MERGNIDFTEVRHSAEAPETEESPEAEEVPASPAQDFAVPEGQEIYQYEDGITPDWGKISVGELMFDVVQARDAAEDSVHITAKPGNVLVGARLYYNPARWEQLMDEAFDAVVWVNGETYDCRKFVETRINGKITTAPGYTKEMVKFSDVLNEGGSHAYLENIQDSDYIFDISFVAYLCNSTNKAEEFWQEKHDNTYFMFDIAAQIPEEAMADGAPVYVVITMGEKQFYCQVM